MIIGHASGIGFAIPSNLARRVGIELLAEGRRVARLDRRELPGADARAGVELWRAAHARRAGERGGAERSGGQGGPSLGRHHPRHPGARGARGRATCCAPCCSTPWARSCTITVLRDGQQQKLQVVTAERPDQREARAGQQPAQAAQARPSRPTARASTSPSSRPTSRGASATRARAAWWWPTCARLGGRSRRALMRGDVIEEVNRQPRKQRKAARRGAGRRKIAAQGTSPGRDILRRARRVRSPTKRGLRLAHLPSARAPEGALRQRAASRPTL